MARKKKQEAGGGAYWMDTYGDLVTNLLCFFVLLYAFSSVDQAKWDALVIAFGQMPTVAIEALDADQEIQEAAEKAMEEAAERWNELEAQYAATGQEIGSLPTDIQSNQDLDFSGIGESSQIKQDFDNLYRRMRTYVTEHELTSSLDLEKEDDKIMLRFKDNLLFDSGKADLKDEAKTILDDVVNLLEDSARAIALVRVEGHTDNRPINNENFPDNWWLSVGRAYAVGLYMMERQPPPIVEYALMGYGDRDPLESNDTEEGKARNRRVEIVIERAELTIPLGTGAAGGLSGEVQGAVEEVLPPGVSTPEDAGDTLPEGGETEPDAGEAE